MNKDEKIDLTKQSAIMFLQKGGFSTFEALERGKSKYTNTLVVIELTHNYFRQNLIIHVLLKYL